MGWSKKKQREYMKAYYLKYRDKIKTRSAATYKRRKEEDPERLYKERQRHRDLKHFGHTREEVFALHGDRCVRCGDPAEAVHHKDRDGRNRSNAGLKPGTDINRLEPICLVCHNREHQAEMVAARNEFYTRWWSPKHRLRCCRSCRRSDIPHNGKGFCTECYPRWSRGSKPRIKREPGV